MKVFVPNQAARLTILRLVTGGGRIYTVVAQCIDDRDDVINDLSLARPTAGDVVLDRCGVESSGSP